MTDAWQYQLQAARQADQTTDQAAGRPKWLDSLPQVYSITDEIKRLLGQLPLVKQTHNSAAQATYLKSVVAEFTKLYYYRIRTIELSPTLAASEKIAQRQQLISECKQRINQILQWL